MNEKNILKMTAIDYKARKVLADVLAKAGKSSYNELYKINNGIRSFLQIFIAMVLEHKLGKDNVYLDTKEWAEGDNPKEVDIVALYKGLWFIIECGGGIHNSLREYGEDGFVYSEFDKISARIEEAGDGGANGLIVAYDSNVVSQECLDKLQKMLSEEYTNVYVIGMGIDVTSIFYRYKTASKDRVETEMKTLLKNVNIILGLVKTSKISMYDLKGLVFALYEFANDIDMKFELEKAGPYCESMKEIAAETGISNYMQHLFFEDEVNGYITDNGSSPIAVALAARRSGKLAGKVVS